jgi:hypothetical protein
MQYVQAEYTTFMFNRFYEVYVTDSLKNTNDILANTYTGNYMTKRYVEVLQSVTEPQKQERTADEIIENIGSRLDEIGAL